ncbi:phage tail spike protein [Candidatus Allofournierella excrementavium]|uniref:phage tail spike protein n=1 Tax=Candidatus Allofournierella excrementavium TaxID=2838591 RepID=UPI003AB3C4AB
MTPILFPADAASFETQGLGALTEAISCEITEAINGEYELAMNYPASGRRYADIKNRCIIYAKPDPYRAGQPFRIYRITKPMNGVVAVYARHISYDLSGVPVLPFEAANAPAAMQGVGEHAAIQSPFTFSSTVEGSGSFTVAVPVSTRAAIGDGDGSILSVFGGELEWDGFTVRLLARRGQDTGVRIAYGKNLTGIEQDENIQNMLTGIIGYWADSESGTVVTSPVVKAPGTYDFDRIGTVDFSSDFDEQPTADALAQKASEYIEANGIGVPEVSISVSWVQLEQYAGGEGLSLLERVTLGDTVTVEFPALGVDATARVVKTVYDALRDRYTSADIGSIQANIADTIAGQQQEIRKRPTTSAMQQAVANATAWLTNGKGYKVERRDAAGNVIDTLYMDTPDINTAKDVLRIGQSGIGFSHTGVNGPFTNAWTIDGKFFADFIAGGVLNCALLEVINLIAQGVQLSGSFSASGPGGTLKLDNGQLLLADENDVVRWQIWRDSGYYGGVMDFVGTQYYCRITSDGMGIYQMAGSSPGQNDTVLFQVGANRNLTVGTINFNSMNPTDASGSNCRWVYSATLGGHVLSTATSLN